MSRLTLHSAEVVFVLAWHCGLGAGIFNNKVVFHLPLPFSSTSVATTVDPNRMQTSDRAHW